MGDCPHTWQEVGNRLNYRTVPVRCPTCGRTAVAKSKGVDPRILPYVAHELICLRLGRLLRERGVLVEMPDAYLSHPLTRQLTGRLPGVDPIEVPIGPWCAHAVVIDDLGPHARHPFGADPPGDWRWPTWLRDFDRWIGRQDGAGETNLLFMPDGRVQPVDWEFVFPWTLPLNLGRNHRIDLTTVPAHPRVEAAVDDAARDAIRALSDEDVWVAVVQAGLPPEVISPGLLVAIYSGLVLRRDLL